MVDLGTVGKDTFSFPTMINKSGQITGGACDPENCRAFLWDPSATAMVDLNELAAEGSGHRLIFASWIKDFGALWGKQSKPGREICTRFRYRFAPVKRLP